MLAKVIAPIVLSFFFLNLQAQDVLSSRYGPYRQGANLDPSNPTRADVQSASFGQLQTKEVDGQIYTQPLYLRNVTIPSGANAGIHNVVFVATEHNTVYAFDDVTLTQLWAKNLSGPPGLPNATTFSTVPVADVGAYDISVEIGVTATPVIDAATGTIYVEAKSKETVGGVYHYVHRLHALDVATGNEKFGGPTLIADTQYFFGPFTYVTGPSVAGTGSGNVSGAVIFNSLTELCRPGLVLSAQTVYVTCASHGDNGPYHGWILGYDATTLQLKAVFNTSPNGDAAGIWNSGFAPAVDAQGNLFVSTGNGTFDETMDASGFPVNGNYGNTVLKLAPDSTSTAANPKKNGWGLKVLDYFTPYNQAALSSADADLGSGAVMLLPDGAGPTGSPNVLVTGGKAGEIYVIDRDNMGRNNPPTVANPTPPNRVVQDLVNAIPGGGGMFSGPAWFNGQVFLSGKSLGRFTLSSGLLPTSPDAGQVESLSNFLGATATITANGTNDGIAWELSRASNQLVAYSTNNLSSPLFTGPTPSTVAKFSVPIVANGRVFAASGTGVNNALTSWGFLTNRQTQTVTFNALAGVTYGVAPITLTASASSGLAVSFTVVSGPGSISGNVLTVAGAGSIVIQAAQGGNVTWAPASATQTLQVAMLSQVINFPALGDRTSSDGPLLLRATGGGSTSPVTFSVLTSNATVSGTTLTVTGLGAVTVRASQAADSNYSAAPDVTRTFQVTLGARALLAATAGGQQGTAVGTAFPTLLAARVTDSGVAISGVPVVFTAPSSAVTGSFSGGAPSATVTSNASGIATAPVYTANGTAGSQTVTATISNGIAATFALTQTIGGTGGTYTGFFDAAGCDAATGWAADLTRLNQAISVDLMEGATVIATTVANALRADVGTSIGDNGLHGFSFTIPDSLKTGTVRTLQVRYTGTSQFLGFSPRTIQCSAPTVANNTGFFDSAGCDAARGWAADLNRRNQSISVDLVEGSTVVASVLANISRPDVGTFLGDNGLHGFEIPIPASLKNGAARTLTVRYTGTTDALGFSPRTIQCSAPVVSNFTGFVDSVGCDTAKGWAADQSRLNQAISVDLVEGASILATVLANGSRADVGAYIGDNGLHGFSIPIPDFLKNGVQRTIDVRYSGTTTPLFSSPRTIQCSTTPVAPINSTGFFESAGCDAATGWAVDLGRLNQAISVDLVEGLSILATVLANGNRPDVGAYVGDNGLHGFSIPIPDSLKNGALRTIAVRYTGTATQLFTSPRTIQCSTAPAAPVNPTGFFESAGCDAAKGWAADLGRLNQAISVDLVEGSSILATVLANGSRPDVGTYVGDNGLHGFSIPIPDSLKNGALRTIAMRYTGTATQLFTSPRTIQCTTSAPVTGPTNPTGFFDFASCDLLMGWAADLANLNQPIGVEVLDAGTGAVVATTTANISRPDIATAIGDNGLHGFSIVTPASLKNGTPRTVSVRYAGSLQYLVNSPRTIQCAATP